MKITLTPKMFHAIFCLIGAFFVYLKLTGKVNANWFYISVPFWFCIFNIDLNIEIARKTK